MSAKLRFILGFLFVIVAFIGVRFVLGILDLNSSDISATIRAQQATIGNAFGQNDRDQDGLPDDQEIIYETLPDNPDTDGDGYLDGEEVIAGCNPLVPAPNDCPDQAVRGQDLTQQSTELVAAGLLEGDLLGQNTSGVPIEQRVFEIAGAVNEDFLASFPTYDIDDIIVTPNNDRATVITYVQEMQGIVNPLVALSKDEFHGELQAGFYAFDNQSEGEVAQFRFMADRYLAARDALLEVAVPSDWTNQHLLILIAMSDFEIAYRNLANGHDDFVSAQLSVQVLPVFIKNLFVAMRYMEDSILSYGS